MTLSRTIAAVLFATLVACRTADAKDVRIGMLPDLDGPYSDISGKGAIEAARMAIDDMRGALPGWKIDLVSADPQNKPDVASLIAQRWYGEEHVDMIAGIASSAVALAVQTLATERHRIHIVTGAASSDLTGRACSPYAADWQDDNYMQASAGVAAMTRRDLKKWFFITADYAFGHNLEDVATGFCRGPAVR